MAKQTSGYLGGFSGRLGPAVGYMWNGKWCLRSHQPMVRNPRTAAQEAHRSLFRQEVQLAARMRWAVTTTLTEAAREAGMTSYNLFVSLNQGAFRLEDNQLAVDWRQLQLSVGPVAPVALGPATVDADGRLEVDFERNPMHLASNAFDEVRLYVYSPALGQGFLAAAVYRRERHIAVVLPEGFADSELHLYAFAFDRQGRFSPTAYAYYTPAAEAGADATGTEAAEPQQAEAVPAAAADRPATAADASPADDGAINAPPPRYGV